MRLFYTRSNLENEYTELDNYNMLQNETNIEQEQEDISKYSYMLQEQ